MWIWFYFLKQNISGFLRQMKTINTSNLTNKQCQLCKAGFAFNSWFCSWSTQRQWRTSSLSCFDGLVQICWAISSDSVFWWGADVCACAIRFTTSQRYSPQQNPWNSSGEIAAILLKDVFFIHHCACFSAVSPSDTVRQTDFISVSIYVLPFFLSFLFYSPGMSFRHASFILLDLLFLEGATATQRILKQMPLKQ